MTEEQIEAIDKEILRNQKPDPDPRDKMDALLPHYHKWRYAYRLKGKLRSRYQSFVSRLIRILTWT